MDIPSIPVPKDVDGLLIFVVVALVILVGYVIKAQTDRITPAITELTKAITGLPETLKRVLHDVVAEREETMKH